MGEKITTKIDTGFTLFEKGNDKVNNALGFPFNVDRNAESNINRAKRDIQNEKNTVNTIKQSGKIIIDLGKRFQNAFGFVSGNNSKTLQRAKFADAISNAQIFVQDSRTSFEELTIINANTELTFGFKGFLNMQENVFAPPPMCSFSKSKRIEETVLDGIDNQVIENFGHRAWDITIQGVLIDMENHVYPSDKVKQLIDFFNIDDILEVQGQIFQDHDIHSIYLIKIDDSPVQGFEDTWQFTLTARSIKTEEASLNISFNGTSGSNPLNKTV